MRKEYSKPIIEIVIFDTDEIILASGSPETTINEIEAVGSDATEYSLLW